MGAPGFADLAIAATAGSRDLTVLTRNLRHFAPLGAHGDRPLGDAACPPVGRAGFRGGVRRATLGPAMMSAEQNELITRTGPGSAAGAVLRRYWQPVALTEELEGARPLRAVRLLGEDLVLFRDEEGRHGLLDRHCSHRGADLAYGRLEDGGLRCAFHGWLFDAAGACREQPAEPEGSTLHERIRHTAYPCVERNGVIFAFLGAGDPPALPGLDCFAAPGAYTFAFKGFVDCNWLQLLEVGIDPAHASFLHRFEEDGEAETGYGMQFRDDVADSGLEMTRVMRRSFRPDIRVAETDYGLRLVTLRDLDGRSLHVRVTNLLFPNAIAIPMSNEMTITQWHVPVDDATSYWYAIFTSFGDRVDRRRMREQRLELYELPGYRPRINKSNDYGYDPAEQATRTFTGMGDDINVHDQWACESMGAVQDRTRENLGTTDAAIAACRRMLREAIGAAGDGSGALPMAGAGGGPAAVNPVAIDAVAPRGAWEGCWEARDRARRDRCPWTGAG